MNLGFSKGRVFCNVVPRSLAQVYQRFAATLCLYLHGRRVSSEQEEEEPDLLFSCLAYFSTLKMEAVCFYETSVNSYGTTRRHIQENSILNNICC
jgi:hypothetical protein